MLTALIDADVLAYQAASSVERPVSWGDGLWTLHAYEHEAEQKFDDMLTAIQTKVEADKVILAFTDKDNWRKDVLPTYKGNRKDVRKPMLLGHLRDRASYFHDTYIRKGLEGDDCLGILQTMGGANTIICSIDKDFKTIPGKHYNFGKDEFFTISEVEADLWHMIQTLTGDTTDGYSGCPGVGIETAKEYLTGLKKPSAYEHVFKSGERKGQSQIRYRDVAAEDFWEIVVALYDRAGLSEEEALVQARVARICRAEDYNFEKKEVILWNPIAK